MIKFPWIVLLNYMLSSEPTMNSQIINQNVYSPSQKVMEFFSFEIVDIISFCRSLLVELERDIKLSLIITWPKLTLSHVDFSASLCTLWAPLREGSLPESHGSWWFGLEIDQFHLVPQRMTVLRQGKIKETKKFWNSNCSWRMTLRSSDKWYPSEWRNSRTQDAGQGRSQFWLHVGNCFFGLFLVAFVIMCVCVCVCLCVLGLQSHLTLWPYEL